MKSKHKVLVTKYVFTGHIYLMYFLLKLFLFKNINFIEKAKESLNLTIFLLYPS